MLNDASLRKPMSWGGNDPGQTITAERFELNDVSYAKRSYEGGTLRMFIIMVIINMIVFCVDSSALNPHKVSRATCTCSIQALFAL